MKTGMLERVMRERTAATTYRRRNERGKLQRVGHENEELLVDMGKLEDSLFGLQPDERNEFAERRGPVERLSERLLSDAESSSE